MENKDFDVLIIGTGMGALTTASLLAQFTNLKVLMFEQHFKAGGFTHTFRREGKFLWDVGIHYIGDMYDGSNLKKIFDIVTGGEVKWNKMPEVFEKFVFPDFTFGVRSSEDDFKKDIIQLFPEEQTAIENYFSDSKKLASYFGRNMILKGAPAFLNNSSVNLKLAGSDSPMISTKEYMDKNFVSEKLKSILCSQWGDYGLPPSKSSFAIHALVVTHYFNGGFYPEGGSGVIADATKNILEKHGGKILTSREVKEILIKDNKAIGLRVRNTLKSKKEGKEVEEIYFGKKIISNAGAFNTYTKLIPKEISIPFKSDLIQFANSHPKISNITLYLGLKESATKLGFKGENHWIYSNLDHEKNFNSLNWTETKEVAGAYLSFPSLKDKHPEGHTAEIIAFCNYEPFEKWKNQAWRERDDEYQNKKKEITELLLNYIEKYYQGFKELVEYAELATPITTEFFTLHKQGTIYGLPCVPERFDKNKSPWFDTITPIENLFLTGADASSPGVSGALMGGVIAFTKASGGISMFKVLKDSIQEKKIET